MKNKDDFSGVTVGLTLKGMRIQELMRKGFTFAQAELAATSDINLIAKLIRTCATKLSQSPVVPQRANRRPNR